MSFWISSSNLILSCLNVSIYSFWFWIWVSFILSFSLVRTSKDWLSCSFSTTWDFKLFIWVSYSKSCSLFWFYRFLSSWSFSVVKFANLIRIESFCSLILRISWLKLNFWSSICFLKLEISVSFDEMMSCTSPARRFYISKEWDSLREIKSWARVSILEVRLSTFDWCWSLMDLMFDALRFLISTTFTWSFISF